MMPTWRGKDAWNKALVQMNGYQDLFGSEDEEPVVENSETSMPQGGARSRRAIVEKYASPNEETKENMYWLIKLPGK
uniref:Uncharacterized protein n=1 Tax=Acrobeloides nanus TaxID=290746 RepID=A0A914CD11_9BILA